MRSRTFSVKKDGGWPMCYGGVPVRYTTPVNLSPLESSACAPYVAFIRCRSTASSVVFVCDFSGSMMNKADVLREELRRAVNQLKPIQQFNIVIFSSDAYHALDNQLLRALPENKRKAEDFLDRLSSTGCSDPIPGMRAAFANQPQLIYLLTDGDFPNNQQVLTEIRKLNASKKVKINTIAFFDRGEEYEKLLKQIADENGGLFRFVSETDLQK